MVWDKQCLVDSEEKDDLISQLNIYKGAYRPAPATPVLFINNIAYCSQEHQALVNWRLCVKQLGCLPMKDKVKPLMSSTN